MTRSQTYCFSLILIVASFGATCASRAVERTVSVSGFGSVEVPPDNAQISLELITIDDDLVRVRNNSDRQVKAILELSTKHGVKQGDFTVSELQIQLSYNEQLKRQFYRVERTMSVKLSALGRLNALLAELLKQPDVKVGAITFATSKPAEHTVEARRKAVSDAREQASHLAGLVGLKLGKALQINTDSTSQTPFVTSIVPVVGAADPFGQRRARNGVAKVVTDQKIEARSERESRPRETFVALEDEKGAADAPVEGGTFGLGEIQFDSRVSIVYELLE